jgi:hypothetical protein
MNAPQLLETLTSRGAVATVEGETLWIEPRDVLTDELRAEIRANKSDLVFLLQDGDRFAESRAPAAPEAPAPELPLVFRRVNRWVIVSANIETAPGAAAICEVLQSFERLFAAGRGGDLPTAPLDVEWGGEPDTLENPASEITEIERLLTEKARECQREKRDLTPEEMELLDGAAEIFNRVWACYNGPGEMWIYLPELNR